MKEEVKNRTVEEDVNKSFEKKLKNWKNSVARSGLPKEYRERRYYSKPGVRKRNEKKENIKNSRKKHRDR